MASPILPSLGLGSGINTTAIVEALVAAEKEPKQNQITRNTTANTAAVSAVGKLKSLLSTYQAALDKLSSKTTPAFMGYASTSSDTTALTVTSDNTAVAGTYSVSVTNLATSSKVASQSFAGGASSAISTGGTLKISQNGTDYEVEVADGDTLQSIRDSINSKYQDKGITANIVNDGNGARLVFSSTTMGAGSDISVTGVDDLIIVGTQKSVQDPVTKRWSAGYVSEKAQDASFTVDGMVMTSKSNVVDSAISGLSFTLLKPGMTTTMTVASNTDGLKTSVQSFVDAYNALIKGVNALTVTSKDASGNVVPGALTGDPSVRSMLSAVRNQLVTSDTSSTSPLAALSQLGIKTTQSDGTLEFDSATFTKALNDKKLGGEIQSLFTSDNGLLARMSSVISPYTQVSDGLLDTRTKQLTEIGKGLSAQQDALNARIASMTESLTKKYNAMDILVGKLKATASNITSMFEAMNAQKSSS